jgi:hypothetical protein
LLARTSILPNIFAESTSTVSAVGEFTSRASQCPPRDLISEKEAAEEGLRAVAITWWPAFRM